MLPPIRPNRCSRSRDLPWSPASCCQPGAGWCRPAGGMVSVTAPPPRARGVSAGQRSWTVAPASTDGRVRDPDAAGTRAGVHAAGPRRIPRSIGTRRRRGGRVLGHETRRERSEGERRGEGGELRSRHPASCHCGGAGAAAVAAVRRPGSKELDPIARRVTGAVRQVTRPLARFLLACSFPGDHGAPPSSGTVFHGYQLRRPRADPYAGRALRIPRPSRV